MWAQELQGPQREGSPEQLLRVHNDGVAHMQNTAFQVLQQGQELAQVRITNFLIATFIFLVDGSLPKIVFSLVDAFLRLVLSLNNISRQ